MYTKAANFHRSLGMVEDTSEDRKPAVTPDTIKLPPMQKPKWMGQVENELLSTSPPVVGPQAIGALEGFGVSSSPKANY